MTNFESTSYHVEDQAGESVAFTVLPPNEDRSAAGTGEHDPVLRLWSTQVMPDNRLINVEVGFSVGDVAGLQSFLNDQFGRGKNTVRLPESAEEIVRTAIHNLQAQGYTITAPDGSSGVYVADAVNPQDSAPATLDYYEPVPLLGVPAQPDYTPGPEAYAEQPQRQCPVIFSGLQCQGYEGHGQSHVFPADARGGIPDAAFNPQTGDGAAPPPAIAPSATPVGAGGEQAAESATGAGTPAVAPSSAPAEKKRTRRTKLEMAFDRAKDEYDRASFGGTQEQATAAANDLAEAHKALAAKDPGNERLSQTVGTPGAASPNPDPVQIVPNPQPPVQFAGEPVNPFTQPPPTQQMPAAFVPPGMTNDHYLPEGPVQVSPAESQAAQGFPCPQMDSSGTRQCVRPYGHELMTATNPEPKPHVFAADIPRLPNAGYDPSLHAAEEQFEQQHPTPQPMPAQPQQPAFSVTTPALTGMTDGGAQILSFQTPPMPADYATPSWDTQQGTAGPSVQGANLQPPAPAAPFLQPVPNGGQ